VAENSHLEVDVRKLFTIVVLAVLAVQSVQAAVPAQAQVFFSPNGGCRDAVLRQIRAARKSVDIAIYSFTAGQIAAALDSAVDRGVQVRLVADKTQSAGTNSVIHSLVQALPVRIGAGSGIMHNKFAVIDDSVTVTGSYNWSDNAELRNDENLLVLSSPALADLYKARFEILWTYSLPESTMTRAAPAEDEAAPSALVPGASTSAPTAAATGGDQVYVTKSGKRFHRAGCGSLSRSCIPISRAEAVSRGYTSCSNYKP